MHTHQTAKTLGKGEYKATFVNGLIDVPHYNLEPINDGGSIIMSPAVTVHFGIAKFTDVGMFTGVSKTGLFVKQQLLGNTNSKGALSIGVNAFANFGAGNTRFEAPLFLSWEFSKKVAVYTSPMLAYFWEFETKHSLSNCLSTGFMFAIGDKFTMSPEIAVENRWRSRNYQFYTTLGIGMRF